MLRLYLQRTVSTVKSDTRSGREKRGFSRALGGGAALGFNQAKPWQWWPVIELVQAQMLVLNQASPRLWPGLRLELALVFTRQSPGHGGR